MSRATAGGQLWHLSHGIVFTNDKQVVYPRLPMTRAHSSPAVVSRDDAGGEHGANKVEENPRSDEIAAFVKSIEPTGEQPSATEAQARVPGLDAPSAPNPENEVPDSSEASSLVAPFTPLDFKIPDERFRAAKLAEPGSPESFWSYSMYRGPRDDTNPEPKVKVHYCKSRHTTERVLKQYFMNEKILGFDLEWEADATKIQGPRRNVCLVQLASPTRVALFHLSLYPKNDGLVAPSLKKIMEDPEVTKAGVWIKGDCNRLRNFLKIESRGLFELSHLYKLVKYSASGQFGLINKKFVSLARQVEDYLHLPLFKGHDVRSSSWSQPLRMDQIIYSSSDAYAAVQLFAVLDHHRQNLDPVPPLPYHAELDKPIRIRDGSAAISAVEDSLETELEEPIAVASEKPATLSENYLESLGDSVEIEAETDGDPVIPDREVSKASKAAKPPPRPKDPRITEAEVWLAQFRVSHPKTRAAPASLRSYYIWYRNEDLKPDDIAALLRDPPLQTSTVTNYILEAIRLEKLTFQKSRLSTEVLSLLPNEILVSRYKTLTKMCEGPEPKAGAAQSKS
ncbi:ribonuclease H-like protein [Thozetella sp. PMI_491]|nr:ribonuclease H-like protein [Thozetella sp. PMI_491]